MTSVDPGQFEVVELARIRVNPNNPRGPNVRENDRHRENLKRSIAEFGVLVPLVVRRVGDHYELIDGERRFWAAKSLKQPTVPAFILDGDLTPKQILQRMFQIHMNRDQWDPVQQCHASEAIFAELAAQHHGDQKKIIEGLADFTGDDRRTAKNRVQFLAWPQHIKSQIYADSDKHDSYWYVVEIEDKIIEPGLKAFPDFFEQVGVNEARALLYKKWDEKVVGAAVEVRKAGLMFRNPIEKKEDRKRAMRIFVRLIKDTTCTYEEAFREFQQQFPTLAQRPLPKPRALLTSIKHITDVLAQYDAVFFAAYKGRTYKSEVLAAVRDLVEACRDFIKRIQA